MAHRPDNWMPFYIGDYLADTMHLTRDQHGGYLLLIIAYWRNGAPLLDDNACLAAIARSSPSEWKKLRPVLVRFFAVKDGRWHHKRIDLEITKARDLTEQRSNAGQASAAAKRQRKINARSTPVATESSTNSKQTAKPLPLPSPSSLRSEDAIASPHAPPLDDEQLQESYRERPKYGTGERLAPNWTPGPVSRQFALSLSLDPDEVAASFRDYYCARPNSDARSVSVDWDAVYRNSCRREANRIAASRKSGSTATASPVTNLYEGGLRAAEAFERRLAAEGSSGVSNAPAGPLLDISGFAADAASAD